MTDKDIIDGFLDGQKPALEAIARWIRSVVIHSAWRGSIWQEDVVSDALYRALIALRAGRFRSECTLQTYISRITRFTIIDWVRRQRRFDDHIRNLEPATGDYYSVEVAFEQARQREVLEHVWEHIDERCRRIWTMIFEERLGYAAVAEREGATAGAVKTWMFRCKEKATQLAREKQGRF
jgi:RNA polymerase sigma factor (sigma-70 family)